MLKLLLEIVFLEVVLLFPKKNYVNCIIVGHELENKQFPINDQPIHSS